MRAFATSIRERLGDTSVDALVLNAGVTLPDVTARTVDGFETTSAVNHLAHYLLLRLLLPVLANRAIVVLTTSGTHDPATKASLATPRHADAELLAHPDRDSDHYPRPRRAAEHAYTASKLCTVLTARLLSEHPDVQTRRLTVVAYDPGQVFGTGLAKDLSFPLWVTWSLLGTPMLGWPLRRLNRNLNSRIAAGNALADLALGLATPPTDAPTPLCDEGGSPGRTRRRSHTETNWRGHFGATAPGSSACRTDADRLTHAGSGECRGAGSMTQGAGLWPVRGHPG